MLDELKLRYKELALLKRLIFCAVLGMLPAIWLYLDESPTVGESYTTAEQQEKAAAANLQRADSQLKNLAKTENELTYTHEQLKKAQTRLPDNVVMDEILRSFGKAAKDASVTISQFEPQPEAVRGDEFKYLEIPLKVKVEAKDYAQLATWLDTVAGSKAKIYLRSWAITRRAVTNPDDQRQLNTAPVAKGNAIDETVLLEQEAKKSRENLRLALAANLSVYRLASETAIAAAEAAQGVKSEKPTAQKVAPSKPQPGGQQPNSKGSRDGGAE